MHRVLLVTENYPPDRGGMSESCDRIVRGLTREGVAVLIPRVQQLAHAVGIGGDSRAQLTP